MLILISDDADCIMPGVPFRDSGRMIYSEVRDFPDLLS